MPAMQGKVVRAVFEGNLVSIRSTFPARGLVTVGQNIKVPAAFGIRRRHQRRSGSSLTFEFACAVL